MTLYRTVEPTLEPVTPAEAKAHLRVVHDSEDQLIAALIRAARAEVERSCGLALVDQSWRLALDDWPASETVAINLHPVTAILSVTVYGEGGEAAVLDPASYLLDPHSAVGVFVAAKKERPNTPMVTLATAHPAKFPLAVKSASGIDPALPTWLAGLMDREERFQVIEPELKAVETFIGKHARSEMTAGAER